MRRWFHCLLIGMLTCSLSVDTAKACWYLRRAHGPCGCWQPTCPPVATWPPVAMWPTCHDVVIGDSGWCDEAACGSVVIVEGWRDDVCCGGASHIVVDSSTMVQRSARVAVGDGVADAAEPVTAADSVAAPGEPTASAEPTPAPAEPSGEPQPAPQEGVATVAPAVPELKPAVDAAPAVETVAALEPAAAEPPREVKPAESAPEEPTAPPVAAAEPDATALAEPAPAPTPAVTAVEPPAPQAEPNIFEEVEAAADAAILDPTGAEPADEPAVAPSEPAAAPGADALFGEPAATPEPAADPLAEPASSEPAAAAEQPAAEPVADPAAEDAPAPAADEPATDDTDPFSDAGREPLRRWVDDTGSYATVGMLVDVRADRVEIRKANGRTVLVPLGRLSEHDRAYAAAAEARLAAERTPSSRETAGL